MKLLYDFFPIALFFIAYKTVGIYNATLILIAASLAQVGFAYYKNKKVETMQLVSLVLIVALGGLTVILRDKSIIMWKPTLVNWAFASAFLITSFFTAKPLIQHLLGSQLELPKAIWTRLNVLWVCFFIVSGSINIYFVKSFQSAELELINAAPNMEAATIAELNCDTDFTSDVSDLCKIAKHKEETWVNFKLFGMLGLTFVFILLQGFYLYRFIQPEDDEPDNNITDA